MPLISVIMPVYNGELYLAEAIDSILAQTFTDFELLIVDDRSEDNSAAIIRSYEERDPRVRFFQLEKNRGQADARNRGFASATGAYITNMDCDDVSLPARLEKQVAFLRAHPDIGGVGTCCRVINAELSTTSFDFMVPPQHALIALNMFFGVSFVGATVMFRSEFLAAVGGYKPGTRVSPDLELSLRLLWQTPIKFANLPERLYIYRKHDSALSTASTRGGLVQERRMRARMLQRLWGEGPAGTVERFQRLRMQERLNWAERRAAKNDLCRLIESLIAHNWVEPDDRSLLIAEVNRRLEQASPRLWQQFCHWRRHHFQRQ